MPLYIKKEIEQFIIKLKQKFDDNHRNNIIGINLYDLNQIYWKIQEERFNSSHRRKRCPEREEEKV